MIAIFQVIFGAIELLLGRRIFWLMVGIAGFLLGLFLTVDMLQMSPWLKLLVGVVVGLVFSGLAVWIQKPMAAVFAFFAFGVAVALASKAFGVVQGSTLYWAVFIIAGLVGASLAISLFDWALIIGTSLMGAGAVMSGLSVLLHFPQSGIPALILFLVLIAVGISSQSRTLSRDK